MTRHRDAILRAGRRATLLSALAASAVLLPEALTQAAQPSIFLDKIHRQTTVTSTVPDNGDQNPYAIVVAPVSAGTIQKDDVLVSNFNNDGNLQGLGTTIVDYNPTTKKLSTFAALPRNLRAVSRRRRTDDGDDHAEDGMGDRRKRAERGWHDQDQGARLPDRARFQR